MRKKPGSCDITYKLDGTGIDSCSEMIEKMLADMDVERENRLRIRLSFEESLLRMRDHFGESKDFRLIIRRWFGRIGIRIELEGDVFNPLSKTHAELEDWSGSLLTTVGLSPTYYYIRGFNILRLTMGRKSVNAAYKILVAVALGLAAGFGLRFFLPDNGEIMCEKILTPCYDLWIRILSVISGPVIFLMVLNSVLNAGTIEEEGGSSLRVVSRYFIFSLAVGTIAVLVSLSITGFDTIAGEAGIDSLSFFEAVLKTVPDNIFSPIINANTPQILLLAFVLGNAIVMLGERAHTVDNLARQLNMIGLLITEAASRCVPLFSALLICLEILQKNMVTLGGMWIILLVSLAVAAAIILMTFGYVAFRKQTGFFTLIRKCLPAFVTAIRTGGIDEGYGRMERSCIKELGLEKHFTKVSLPYGLVLYMPVNVIGTLIFTIYAGVRYGAEKSFGWILIAIVLSVFLFVATPPVPGANLLAYIMIFVQLGIPSAALIDAMIFDILFGIFATAGNQALLQMDLILQADKIGLLNKDILRR